MRQMKRFGYLTRLLDNTPAKKMMEKNLSD